MPHLNATADEISGAQHQHENQFQVLDILTGNICPELNGRPEYVDMVGLNFYYSKQWTYNTYEFLKWNDIVYDARWKPLNVLVSEVYERYNKPIVITETSHPKEDRPLWINMIANECRLILENEIPLAGVCIYPVIDRPDWDDLIT